MMDSLEKKNRRTGLMVLGIVGFMLGLTAVSVPLYELYCRITGFGGQAAQAAVSTGEIVNRDMRIRFNTDINPNLPWEFKPDQGPMVVKLGQEVAVSYTATNDGRNPVAGTALYNVDPPSAGKYFHKTQCFCFDYQLIAPRESVHFPVVFYVDPALNDDPQLKDLKTITLSYSFFKAESKELDAALEAFYNGENSGNVAVKIE
jgi:cytochrome c oxidase assembly protein subunit 11